MAFYLLSCVVGLLVVVAAVGDQAQIPLPTRLFLLLSSDEISLFCGSLWRFMKVSQNCAREWFGYLRTVNVCARYLGGNGRYDLDRERR